jgi:hypothetical protein
LSIFDQLLSEGMQIEQKLVFDDTWSQLIVHAVKENFDCFGKLILSQLWLLLYQVLTHALTQVWLS